MTQFCLTLSGPLCKCTLFISSNVPVVLDHMQVTVEMVGSPGVLHDMSSLPTMQPWRWRTDSTPLSLCLGNKWRCMAGLPVMWMNEQAITVWHVGPAFVWCCSWVPQQWRRDGICLPDEGNWRGVAADVTSLICLFTALVIYSVCLYFFYSQSAPPFSLLLSPWSIGIMDHCIHKGKGGEYSQVVEESQGSGEERIGSRERVAKWRGGWEDVRFRLGSAGLFHIKRYDVLLLYSLGIYSGFTQ